MKEDPLWYPIPPLSFPPKMLFSEEWCINFGLPSPLYHSEQYIAVPSTHRRTGVKEEDEARPANDNLPDEDPNAPNLFYHQGGKVKNLFNSPSAYQT